MKSRIVYESLPSRTTESDNGSRPRGGWRETDATVHQIFLIAFFVCFCFSQQMRQVFGPFLDQVLGGGASAEVKGAWDAFLAWLQEYLEEKKR